MSLLPIACLDPTSGDEGAELQQELTSAAVCTARNSQTEDCHRLRESLTAGQEGERAQILARAFQWVEDGVMYSTQKTYPSDTGSYRSDCSGFVSMAWGLGASVSTRGLAPFTGDVSYVLPSYEHLLPGDALNRPRAKGGNFHVALFAGWANQEHSAFYLLQELESGSPAMLSLHDRAKIEQYTPIRKLGL